jgi:hypothetical protein
LGEIAVAGLPGRSPASVVFTGVDQVTPWSVEGINFRGSDRL